MLSAVQIALSAVSGLFVGFSLGLIGGGGSILAVPLLLYFVGLQEVPDAVHIAVGSTAMAVGLNALINSIYHLRRRNLSARVGTIFAIFGVVGSIVGAYVGHLTSGVVLLAAFAVAMVAIGFSMFFTKEKEAETKASAPRSSVKIALFGLLVGFLSGFFGIGGGFLIVPALIYAAGLDTRLAVGTSLISVAAFGLTTGLEYMYFGKVAPEVVVSYLAGGVAGGYLGAKIATSIERHLLRKIYAVVIIAVGIYIFIRALG